MKGFAICLLASMYALFAAAQTEKEGWKLVWNDEFDVDGRPDAQKWDYARGFVRNYELQWYAPENAFVRDGNLVIEARPADFPCPAYQEGNKNWRNSRKKVEWTSAALITKGKYSFQYGRLEVRARIPVCKGAWPAIWLLGMEHPWPGNGEIDVLEYYQHKGVPTILANACWAGDTDEDAEWDSSYTPLAKNFIRLYLDDELLNEIDLKRTINGKASGTGINPFHYQQYLLLNLALDTRVKELNPADFPMKYEIDYVRVFQK